MFWYLKRYFSFFESTIPRNEEIVDHQSIRTIVRINVNEPLLCTIYAGDKLYTVKIIAKEDLQILQICSRSSDKFEALTIAVLHNEDTSYYQNTFFTPSEIYNFYDRLKRAKSRFFGQIYQKVVNKEFVKFPDKIFNTIAMGQILISNMTCVQKQDYIWNELCQCRGKRVCAITTFYSIYIKTN